MTGLSKIFQSLILLESPMNSVLTKLAKTNLETDDDVQLCEISKDILLLLKSL
jgi:hypothetical protein